MRILKVLVFPCLCFLVVSCERTPQKHTYEEIVLKRNASPLEMMTGDDPHKFLRNDPAFKTMFENNGQGLDEIPGAVDSDISWTVPSEWKSKPGGGFRLVSFVSNDPAQEIDVSIVKLEGPAGGIKPNLIRWMGQINVAVPADAELDGLLAKQMQIKTDEGVAAVVIDFAQMQSSQPDTTPSMLAAIIEMPEYKIFIKMMGTKSAIKHHTETFLSLCKGLKIKK